MVNTPSESVEVFTGHQREMVNTPSESVEVFTFSSLFNIFNLYNIFFNNLSNRMLQNVAMVIYVELTSKLSMCGV